jgi:hypothetical protein
MFDKVTVAVHVAAVPHAQTLRPSEGAMRVGRRSIGTS